MKAPFFFELPITLEVEEAPVIYELPGTAVLVGVWPGSIGSLGMLYSFDVGDETKRSVRFRFLDPTTLGQFEPSEFRGGWTTIAQPPMCLFEEPQ